MGGRRGGLSGLAAEGQENACGARLVMLSRASAHLCHLWIKTISPPLPAQTCG
jgi:hypothetical protein